MMVRNETEHFLGTDTEGMRWFAIINLVEVNKPEQHMRDHSRVTLTHQFSSSGFAIAKGRREADMAGQCLDSINLDGFKPAKGWTIEDIRSLLEVSRRWHLNDMNAGSYEQDGWTISQNHRETPDDIGKPDSTGYKFGSEWLSENLPDDVLAEIERLRSLPSGRVPQNY